METLHIDPFTAQPNTQTLPYTTPATSNTPLNTCTITPLLRLPHRCWGSRNGGSDVVLSPGGGGSGNLVGLVWARLEVGLPPDFVVGQGRVLIFHIWELRVYVFPSGVLTRLMVKMVCGILGSEPEGT